MKKLRKGRSLPKEFQMIIKIKLRIIIDIKKDCETTHSLFYI